MIALALLCTIGLAVGFLLLLHVPLCRDEPAECAPSCSIIIPARNEARNLPKLLMSIGNRVDGTEVIVVDDQSTDGTASVAVQHGARVVAAPPLAAGWTGKTSACVTGAAAARHDVLLFIDADTCFEAGGVEKLLQTFTTLRPGPVAFSVVPFHVTSNLYEELSIFFNLMMIFGAGGFGTLGHGRLFGQSLVISSQLYRCSGTHAAVRSEILENFAFAGSVADAGGRCICMGGRGTLRMRMFSDGFAQLCEGWTKAFASGAAASSEAVLAAAVLWLSCLCGAAIWLVVASGASRGVAAAFYLCFALQTGWFAHQVGSFRWYTSAVYPVPLLFFFIIFGRSLKRRAFGQPVAWRGRQV